MRRHSIPIFTFCAATALTSSLVPHSAGALPGIHIPAGATRSAPACGACHVGSPIGANGLTVSLRPSARSLVAGQVVQIVTSSVGGASGANSGFASETTAGTFQAGAGLQTDPARRLISHTAPGSRQWNYSLNAPTTPGPVELYTVVNTVNLNGNNTGDVWGFHGFDGTSRINTPVRLFVNATGVTPFGDSCEGSFGNYPVLGSDQVPSVGNASFSMTVVNTAASVVGNLLLGFQTQPIDLTPFGAPGCNLNVLSIGSLPFVTSGGSSQFADGVGVVGLGIPNDVNLRGVTLAAQALILDAAPGRTLPITMTNGLSIQIQ